MFAPSPWTVPCRSNEWAPLDAARASLELSQESYKAGQANFLQVLEAQRLFQQARLGYAQARSQRYLDTAQPFEVPGRTGRAHERYAEITGRPVFTLSLPQIAWMPFHRS